MKALQELLPGPRKYPSDSASMLDDAIEYLKTLKLQIKMMYMRGRFIFQVPSVLPTGFQMPQFAASAPGMGMGMVDLCNSGAISMMSIPPTYIQNSAAYGNLPIPQLTEAASTSSTTPIFSSGFWSSFPCPNQGEASSEDTGN
ncbi:hypothetical protein K2173_008237 [Erythroxylum novogranatense]|uniref:BHLH domain-containing protein n=1 Tax=Erythroxylum novogranatense TaxID=1862640 RepID=A0AAV8TV83_9ROSI|nr:hypothetical protein K2173_008237 [Erythroxylum novogranatense]